MVLRHPVLPGETLDFLENGAVVDFRGKDMNKFSLKYLAKFICEYDIESVCINGSFDRPMPIRAIQSNTLVSLNLRDTGLYSEDLFIISQVIKGNTSLRDIDLSKNMIGLTYVDEREVLEIKMKNQERLKQSTFDKLFYDSLGLEHFTIAFKNTDRIRSLDLSENDIGSENFLIMLQIFESNIDIENLNIADCQLDGSCVGQLCEIL